MNKTVSVNIGGFAFIIEESAYDTLRVYLAKVKSKFSVDEAEIMMDIEARIAEILKGKLENQKDVIEEVDIQDVISIMGSPEDYQDDESEINNEDEAEFVEAETLKRKLFRDTDNEVIGGVCSGIAKYFEIDAVVVRVLFIFFSLFLFSGILVYIILLIIIPEARTTAQKIQMNGDPVNLTSLKAHFSKLGEDINENIKDKNINKKVNTVVNSIVKVVLVLINAFSKIVGVALVIAGVIGLFFTVLYFLGYQDIVPFTSFIKADGFYDFLMIIYSSTALARIAFFSLIAVLIIPLLTFLYSGIKLVFEIKSSGYKPIKISLAIMFGIAISMLTIVSIRAGVSFSDYGEHYEQIDSADEVGDALYILIKPDNSEYFPIHSMPFSPQFMYVKEVNFALKNIKVHLKNEIESDSFNIYTIQHSRGINERIAIENAMNIDYKIEIKGDTLYIPRYLLIANSIKFRGQGLNIHIKVPIGKRVHFGEGTHQINSLINDHTYYYDDFDHHYHNRNRIKDTDWIGTDKGLECLNCNY